MHTAPMARLRAFAGMPGKYKTGLAKTLRGRARNCGGQRMTSLGEMRTLKVINPKGLAPKVQGGGTRPMEGEGRQRVTLGGVATTGPGTAKPNGNPMAMGVVSQWDLTASPSAGKFLGQRTMFCVPLMATFSTFPQRSSSHARWRNISKSIQPVAGTGEAGANPKV